MERHSLTLFELNSLVREVIESTLDHAYWVEAELSELREVRGHCYMELVQKDLRSATPVARASAKCWKTTWMRLQPRFERATRQPLRAGMKVLLLVVAQFHEQYGFSWIVQDIDPTYTLGDMARKRQEIIQQLKAEGVFDMQKQLALPMFAQHIAVISAENAAGYGDFCNQLADNDYGLYFRTELFPAVMQGEQVEQSVIRALDNICQRMDEFHCVVIIRGGGATADMSGFDTLALAENVAQFPLPIITGIGHDRDESILDMVSCVRVKTPTAAAAFLIDHLAAVLAHVEGLQERILSHVTTRMERELHRLNRCAERIPILFSNVRTGQEMRMQRITARMQRFAAQRLIQEAQRLDRWALRLPDLARHRLKDETTRLEKLEIKLDSLNPELLLKRGYSITTFKGRVLRDASHLKPGDEIETRLEKGRVKSVVK